jgi:hypothetical protein
MGLADADWLGLALIEAEGVPSDSEAEGLALTLALGLADRDALGL